MSNVDPSVLSPEVRAKLLADWRDMSMREIGVLKLRVRIGEIVGGAKGRALTDDAADKIAEQLAVVDAIEKLMAEK